MNAYACDKCPWTYDWKMGDRVRAMKRHELAHLLDQREPEERTEKRKVEVPANQLIAYIEQRLRNTEFV